MDNDQVNDRAFIAAVDAAMEVRREKIRAAVQWLDPIVNKAAPNFPLWAKLHPQEAEEFWEHWDLFDRASYGYIVGLVPVEKIRQMLPLIVSAIERAKA